MARLCLLPAQASVLLGTLAFSLVAYLAGNRHCATDQFGKGCGRIRWAAVQIKRKGIAMCGASESCPSTSLSADPGPYDPIPTASH